MATKKLTELPVAGAFSGTEVFLTTQSLISKQVGVTAVKNYISMDVYYNSSLLAKGYSMDFTGTGVNVSNIGNAITVDIPGDYVQTVNGHSGASVTVTKADIGLSNVDNTSDVNKPISTATQTALDDKVDKIFGKGLSTNDFTDENLVDVQLNTDIRNAILCGILIDGGILTATTGIEFTISAGTGYARNNLGKFVEVTWNEFTLDAAFDGTNFIYIDYTGTVIFETDKTNTDSIFLGIVRTNEENTVLSLIDTTTFPFQNHLFNISKFIENAIGIVIESGCLLAAQAFPNQLKLSMSQGYLWSNYNRIFINQETDFYKIFNSTDGYIFDNNSPNVVDTASYNDPTEPSGTALVPMSTGYYKKDMVIVTTEGVLFVVYGDNEYATLDEARSAPLPFFDPNYRGIISKLAALIIQEGATEITEIIDLRPIISRIFDSGIAAIQATAIDHSTLVNLGVDDHPQYLNTTRGDIRYYRKTDLDGGQLDNRYYTETEVNSLLTGKSNTGHSHSNATTSVSGFMSSTDKSKLDNIEANANANSPDAYLLARANHTGTQDASTITGLTKSSVGLSNVDNTSDADKIISDDTQDALDLKVDKVGGKGLSTNDFTNYYKSESELATYIADENGSSVHVSGGTITLTGGIGFQIASGVGYTRNLSGKLVRVTWSTIVGSTTNNGDNFINVDYNGSLVITSSSAQGDLIALGYISTALANTVIVGYSNAHLTGRNHLFNLGEFLRSSVGSLVQSGISTAMQTSPNELKIYLTGGYVWTLLNRFTVPDKTTFTKLFNSSDNGFVVDSVTTANTVNTAYYNNSSNAAATALVAMTSGYYKKDLIAVTPEGTCFYIYATAEYATLDEAKEAPTPAVPENIKLAVIRSAALVSQQGATAVDTVLDIRPMLSRLFDTGTAASNATVISHSNLTDLGIDSHLQYHTDARGDARYYRKTELDGGSLDSRYYTETEVDSLLTGYSTTGHSHSNATTSVSGFMSASDKTKLDGIATDATTNQTDAYLLARANHTGTQDASTITGLTKSSVGLGNVQNVDQTNADNIIAGTLDNARLSMNLNDIGDLVLNTNDYMQFDGANIVNVSPGQVKTSLSLTKSDVGLSNVVNVDTSTTTNITEGTNLYFTNSRAANAAPVQSVNGLSGTVVLTKTNVGLSNVANVDTTNANNISSGTLANARLTTNLSQIGGLSFSANDVIQYVGGVLTNRTTTQLKTSLSLTSTDVGLGNVTNSLQTINAGNGVSFASGTLASRPAAGTNGRLYATTNDGIYLDNGTSWVLQDPAYTGDVTKAVNATSLTLATVNSNIGTFNNITINAKGLATAGSNANYLVDSGANGVLARTSLNTTTARTMTGTSNTITVTNGDGVSDNPTFTIADNAVLPGTDGVTLPSGTTGQRGSATSGKTRYNTTLNAPEVVTNGVYAPFGKIVQFITGDIAQTSGTTTTPYDNTIPLSTEGFQIWSQSITPLYNNSTIVVIFNIHAESSVAGNAVTLALLNGTTTIAAAAGMMNITANSPFGLGITKHFTSGTTSAITLSARIGGNAASTIYVNRGNTETFGGTTSTSYIIMEVI